MTGSMRWFRFWKNLCKKTKLKGAEIKKTAFDEKSDVIINIFDMIESVGFPLKMNPNEITG